MSELRALTMPAATRAYLLTGRNVNFRIWRMTADTGAFHVTGYQGLVGGVIELGRRINITVRVGKPATSVTINFYPDLSAGDGQVVLEKVYSTTLTSPTGSTTLSGSIVLPVFSTGAIPFRVQFPRETGYNEQYIYVEKGDPIDLSLLLSLGALSPNVIDLTDLNDVTITDVTAGQYLRYDGTEWTNSSDYTAERVSITVRNAETTTMPTGTIVYISGATGDNVLVRRAQADTEEASSKTVGMVIQPITSNGTGLVAVNGTVENVNTAGFPAGTDLWLSPTNPGEFTSTVPVAPDRGVFIGWVARSNANAGRIVLHIQNGYEIEELHDVLLTDLADGDLLVYDEDTALWNNKSKADLDIASDSEVVKVTGAQTVAGAKTFTDNVVVSRAGGQVILDTPTQPSSGGFIGSVRFRGFNSAWNASFEGARIVGVCDGTPTIDTGIPTSIQFQTANTGAAPLDRMRLQKTGNLTIGTTTDYDRRLVSASTTTQLRLMYDANNYCDIATTSGGNTIFTATGSSNARVSFNSPVTLNSVTFAQKFKAVVSPNISYVSDDEEVEVTPAPNSHGVCTVTVETENITFLAPSGTFDDGQKLLLRIVASDVVSLTFNSAYKAGTVELPIETVAGKTQYLGFFYSVYSSKWELVGYTSV